MVSRQSKRDPSVAPIREFHGHRLRYLGQLEYEGLAGQPALLANLFRGVGVRLYQEVDSAGQYLCVESSETGEEAWYRVDGARLVADGDER